MDETRRNEMRTQDAPASVGSPGQGQRNPGERNTGGARLAVARTLPFLLTLIAVAVAALLGWAVWDAFIAAPWTRDGTVRAFVVTETPEVAGRLVGLPVQPDQFVHKGQLLMEVERTNYQLAVVNAEASVEQAQANLDNKRQEAARRQGLSTLSTSVEETQNYVTQAKAASAALQQAVAALAQARVNLGRTHIVSAVNGFVTNLTAQVGDYVTVGQRVISIVNSDSFWVDGYFEETQLARIRIGDRAHIKLMSYGKPLSGRVAGMSRGIEVPNAQPDAAGLARVNPVFTWIRLAQRIPVRIALDPVPSGVTLVVGMTATVQTDPNTGNGPELSPSAPSQ